MSYRVFKARVVAEMTGVSERSLYRWAKKGLIGHKVGESVFFSVKDLEYLAGKTQRAPSMPNIAAIRAASQSTGPAPLAPHTW